jgi:CelD/BcsL family acetyltransferase involved in cellulose biosynthesis
VRRFIAGCRLGFQLDMLAYRAFLFRHSPSVYSARQRKTSSQSQIHVFCRLESKEISLRIAVLREIPEDSSLLKSWNDLTLEMEQPQIFYNCEWALALQTAYQNQQKPLLFLGYEGDVLVGVASLSTRPGDQQVSFLAGNTADYCEFLTHPQRRAEFVEGVLAELRKLKLTSLVLANLPADSSTPVALRSAAKKTGFHLYVRPAYLCSQVDLGSGERRGKLKTTVTNKRQLKRCLKALEHEGPVKLIYLRSWPEIKAALPSFVDAHLARFRAKHGTSFLHTPERQHFMEDLARRVSSTGAMTLTLLMVGDRPVAWSYGFQFHKRWFLYQTTFDIRSEDNSPGYCVLGKILIAACDMDTMEIVDLGLGAEGYKEWFANSGRQTLYATLTTSPVRHVREIARYRLSAEVRRFPKLEAALRTTRSKLGL